MIEINLIGQSIVVPLKFCIVFGMQMKFIVVFGPTLHKIDKLKYIFTASSKSLILTIDSNVTEGFT